MDNFEWIPVCEFLPRPTMAIAYDVTIESPEKSRLVNVGIYLHDGWMLLIDSHNYKDCHVVAWKKRSEPYNV